MKQSNNKAKLAIIISMAIWGTIGVFVKNIALGSAEIALLRGALALVFIGGCLLIRKEKAGKEVLKKAFQTRLIEDERAWLEMHELRNRIAHTYEETELAEIFHLIVGSYIDKMQELQKAQIRKKIRTLDITSFPQLLLGRLHMKIVLL